jgi:hypothetical protein
LVKNTLTRRAIEIVKTSREMTAEINITITTGTIGFIKRIYKEYSTAT